MTSCIDNGHGHGPLALLCMGQRGVANTLGVFERQNGLSFHAGFES